MNLLIDAAGQKAAVHREHVAGDETGALRSQENGGAHKFRQLSEAVHGRTQEKLFASFRTIEQLRIEFSAEYTRRDRIYADTMAGPLNG